MYINHERKKKRLNAIRMHSKLFKEQHDIVHMDFKHIGKKKNDKNKKLPEFFPLYKQLIK